VTSNSVNDPDDFDLTELDEDEIYVPSDEHADVQLRSAKLRHLATANYGFLQTLCAWKSEARRELIPANMELPLCKICEKLEDFIPTPDQLTAYFSCDTCGIDRRIFGEDTYSVRPNIWKLAHPDHIAGESRNLQPSECIGCFEKRLGRTLLGSDFTKETGGCTLAEAVAADPTRYGQRIRERAVAESYRLVD